MSQQDHEKNKRLHETIEWLTDERAIRCKAFEHSGLPQDVANREAFYKGWLAALESPAAPSVAKVEGQDGLREAVRKLYYAAVWHADRQVDEAKLWEDVRDAAGFEKGKSPKEQNATLKL